MPSALSEATFVKKLEQANPSLRLIGSYTNLSNKTTFECMQGHIWDASPRNMVYNGAGCPHCSRKARKTTASFTEELNKLNAKRQIQVCLAPNQDYVSSFVKLLFVCGKGHTWLNTPSNIINSKQTCKVCSGKNKKTTPEFVDQLSKVTENITLAKGEEYITAQTKVSFQCSRAHVWTARPIDILLGLGCPDCVRRGFSKKAVNWLDSLAKAKRIFIQHAQNGGEYRIPNTQWYADGFCKETNTIYEFHGDVFHGNPTRFASHEHCHPFDKRLTAGHLYNLTITREAELIRLGYNLIIIWESEYDATIK